jgi:diadenosine tetraphosphate (Ap4A) HIT family hydrolase
VEEELIELITLLELVVLVVVERKLLIQREVLETLHHLLLHKEIPVVMVFLLVTPQVGAAGLEDLEMQELQVVLAAQEEMEQHLLFLEHQ